MKPRKKYAFHQSPFYKLASKKKLLKYLGTTAEVLKTYSSLNNPYNVFYNEDNRLCEEPQKRLKAIHKRIESLLKRIEVPLYLHSIKGRSYVTNAREHVNNEILRSCDVKKFYPSTKFGHVFGLFFHKFKCEKDIATVLARFLSYKGHLPTGSPASGLVAYFAHKEMFDEIAALASTHGITFTCYVDDLSFSASRISEGFANSIRMIIRRRGLISHKEKFYRKGSYREITGVGMKSSRLLLPNSRQKAIHALIAESNLEVDLQKKRKVDERLLGRLNEAGQVDNRFVELKNSVSEALKKIKK